MPRHGDEDISRRLFSLETIVMKRLLALTFIVVIAGSATLVRAADKPNPTGTWKWEAK